MFRFLGVPINAPLSPVLFQLEEDIGVRQLEILKVRCVANKN